MIMFILKLKDFSFSYTTAMQTRWRLKNTGHPIKMTQASVISADSISDATAEIECTVQNVLDQVGLPQVLLRCNIY